MSVLSDDLPLDPTLAEDVRDARRVAYSYLEDAFAEAKQDGLDSDALAHAALFAAMRTLVETYGEEATAVFAESLPEKIRTGRIGEFAREREPEDPHRHLHDGYPALATRQQPEACRARNGPGPIAPAHGPRR